MKKVIILVVLLLAAFCIYWFMLRTKPAKNHEPKQAPVALKTHSDTFNVRVDRAIDAYLLMKDAFVESDTTGAKVHAARFLVLLDSIPVQELKNDTAMIFETAVANIEDIKANTRSLLAQSSLDEMRKDFSMVTEMMFPAFFKTINYEGRDLYVMHCPMAFGDDLGASWLSGVDEVVNPYLGKDHVKYKATMLHCGEVVDSIKAGR